MVGRDFLAKERNELVRQEVFNKKMSKVAVYVGMSAWGFVIAHLLIQLTN